MQNRKTKYKLRERENSDVSCTFCKKKKKKKKDKKTRETQDKNE